VYNLEYFLAAVLITLIFKTILIEKRHEMKLWFRNYAAVMPIENNCIISNNKKLNSLQRYNIAQNYRILPRVV
jgi:hypothetical protein